MRVTYFIYSSSDKEQICQGADFILEEKVKSQKSIAPKGIVSAKVWQRISRSVDKLENLDKKTKWLLNLNREITSRNMLLENETIQWRALLRLSNYISGNESNRLTNIYGEPLHEDMRNLSGNAKKKVMQYFCAAINVNLEIITYDNLQVMSLHNIEDMFIST